MFEKKFLMISVLLCCLIFFLTLIDCGKKVVTSSSNADLVNLVKNSSFEKNGEPRTDGWKGTWSNIYRDAPGFAGGGLWSLRLTGGDVLGGATYLLGSAENEAIYELSCWMKNDQYGWGRISFYTRRLGLPFKTTGTRSRNWTRVALIDTLSVAPGDSIYVLLEAGGFIWGRTGSTLFDLIKVIKIN